MLDCFYYQILIMVQWQQMKDHSFVPAAAKGNERRKLCGIH
jgi:hypothetical protein